MFSRFVGDEDGAVTVDWVVLTAVVTGLGFVAASAVGVGTGRLGGSIGEALGRVPAELQALVERAESGLKTLVEMSFDDGDFTGWSSARTGFSDALGTFLGPFGGSEAKLTYGIDLPEGTKEAVVSFDLLILDSWDADIRGLSRGRGDGMTITSNGQEVAFELFMHQGHAQAGDFTSARTSEVTIDGSTYTTTMTLKQYGRLYGDTWTDQVWQVEIAARNPPAGGFQLGLGATTDQSRADESFGLNDFKVQAR